MAKKQTTDQSTNSSTEEQQLVAKVDEMMATENQNMALDYEPELAPTEPEKQKEKPAKAKAESPKTKAPTPITPVAAESTPPPLDIFADVPGAPPLENAPATDKVSAKKAKKITVFEGEAPVNVAKEEDDQEPEASEEPEPETSDQPEPTKPENFDDPVIAKVIEDIVSHESDVALLVQDQEQASAAEAVAPTRKEKHTHHIFWTLVAIVCLLAIAMAAFIINPNLLNPFHSLHWGTIRSHF